MSPSLHDLDAVEEARDALRAIREDAEAEVEGREVAIRIRRWNLWTAAACGSVLVVPLPSLGWRGVVEAGLCLMLGFVVGETLNQRVRDQEAAAGRVGPRA